MNKKEYELKLSNFELSFISYSVLKQLEEVQKMYDKAVEEDEVDDIYISTLVMLKNLYEKINSCY